MKEVLERKKTENQKNCKTFLELALKEVEKGGFIKMLSVERLDGSTWKFYRDIADQKKARKENRESLK